MACTMIHVLACIVALFMVVVVGEGAKPPKPPMIETCNDYRFSKCYKVPKSCPLTCPQKCKVDCWTCEPLCVPIQSSSSLLLEQPVLSPPPPLNGAPPPKTGICKDKRFPKCFKVPKVCPDTCPHKYCKVNCWTCEAHCIPIQSLSLSPPPTQPQEQQLPSDQILSPPPHTYTHPPPPPPPHQTPLSSPPPHPTHLSSPPPPPQTPLSSPPPHTTPLSSPPPPPQTPLSSPPPHTRPLSSPPPHTSPLSSPPPPPQTPLSSSPPPSTPLVSPPPPTDSPPVVLGEKAYCKVKRYPQCYRQEFRCPSTCPDQCEVDCVTCSPVCECNRPGAVCQDPRFTGADGITFYFHGKKEHDFCIVSDTNLHINGHFIGRRNEKMKRDFTWVQALGILFGNHKLYIGAKKTSTWIDTIDRLDLAFDGEPINLSQGEGVQWTPEHGIAITRTRDANSIVITVENNFQIKANVVPITEKDSKIHKYGVTDEDCFAHLDLGFKFYSLSDEVNGLMGQTYAPNYVSRAKMGVDMPVLGGDKEYSSSGIFTTDCSVSRFSGIPKLNSSSSNLKCSNTGLEGRGVVCK